MFVFETCRGKIHNRGRPPIAFLEELVRWGATAPASIFAANARYDVYSSIKGRLGPWQGQDHRVAAMLEVLRVLGGYESSWNWQAGRDETNEDSNTPCTMEAGLFQCSGDSMGFDRSLVDFVVAATGTRDCGTFRNATVTDQRFAIEYCARLLRFTTKHHGPLKFGHIHPWLSRDCVDEFTTAVALERARLPSA